MIVPVVVEGQSLRWYGRIPEIADNSIEFVQLEFRLPEDWDGLVIVAQFAQTKTYNCLLVNNRCFLPVELVAGPCEVSVFGYLNKKATRGTTIPLKFNISRSGFVSSAETPIPPTPDLYAQLIEHLSDGNVVYDEEQKLTDEQKELARKNIGAQPAGTYLTEVPEGYAKTTDIPTKPEDIGAQPSGDYALRSEIPNIPVQSVNGKTGVVQLSAFDVGARPDNWMPTANQIGADPVGTALTAVAKHNTSEDSHNDIRLELQAINNRLTAFFDSDEQTLDELSEIVAYITSNKTLIDSITTSKVSVVDIINNLTTNVSNKPLSAAQGVILKGMIDTISSNLSNYQPKGDYLTDAQLEPVRKSAEEANVKVDTLREVVSKLHSNIVETARGEVITVSDSAEAPLQGLKIFGKTVQATTTGKNLLQNTATTQTINGVTFTVNADGSITANGQATNGAAVFTIGLFELADGLEYTLTGCPRGGSLETYRMTLAAYEWNDTGDGITFTATKLCGVTCIISDGYTASNLVFYPMIRLASVTDSTYEPYTGGIPSPNPDYPQALESIGDSGSVTVTVCGKNLFDANSVESGILMNGVVISNVHWLCSDFIPASPLTNYCISQETNAYFQCMVAFYDKTKTYISTSRREGGLTEWTFQTPENAKYMRIAYSITVNDVAVDRGKIMLNVGTEAFSREPYKESTTATVSTPNGLPGIPVESDGQQWICDEVDFEKGVYVQRVKEVVLSSSNFLMISPQAETYNTFMFRTDIQYDTEGNYITRHLHSLCNKFKRGIHAINTLMPMTVSDSGWGGQCYINVFVDTSITDIDTFLSEIGSDCKVLVPLAEENTISLSEIDPDALAQYATMNTNYPNTTVFNDAGAHIELKYVADTKKYVDNKFAELAAALVSST